MSGRAAVCGRVVVGCLAAVCDPVKAVRRAAAGDHDQDVPPVGRRAEKIAAAGEQLEQLRARAVAQANAAGQATDEYVRDNPWRAIGIAAAVSGLTGLVAGLLIARR